MGNSGDLVIFHGPDVQAEHIAYLQQQQQQQQQQRTLLYVREPFETLTWLTRNTSLASHFHYTMTYSPVNPSSYALIFVVFPQLNASSFFSLATLVNFVLVRGLWFNLTLLNSYCSYSLSASVPIPYAWFDHRAVARSTHARFDWEEKRKDAWGMFVSSRYVAIRVMVNI